MEATRALDSPYLNLFTRWLRSVVLKSLKAVKEKFLLKKIVGKYWDQENDPTWREVRKFSFPSPAATRFKLEQATNMQRSWAWSQMD